MQKVTKAVVTAAGYATRFLPITKAVPKEMLPLGDKPVIHYILAELEAAGITDVLLLVGRGRECLLNYLDKNYEIDDHLDKVGSIIKTNFFPKLNIYYRRVPMPKGVADCVWHARSFAGSGPFLLAYSDDVFFGANPTDELLAKHKKTKQSAILCSRVPIEEAHKYGVVGPSGEITEKPASPSSDLVAVGRYLLTPEIFDILKATNFVCMTKALNKLENKSIVVTGALRFDTGNKEGFFKAFEYVMRH